MTFSLKPITREVPKPEILKAAAERDYEKVKQLLENGASKFKFVTLNFIVTTSTVQIHGSVMAIKEMHYIMHVDMTWGKTQT